ncbi:unnamed protein product [Nippostrongylus brasiliensis]|uniref:Membralin (inferred by orthology to a human protein) n=1 Tax=Nippostrongylus brasiliensis TaxID=27835 RepID=A0A0N4Y4I9_NIPBR|nr:unnamed protein product [Nippostrongylus brasiliensis]
MADGPIDLNVDVDVPQANQQQNRNADGRQQAQNNTQFGVVRDRLFHAMLVKVALSYSSHVSIFWRRVIEFISLLIVSFFFTFPYFGIIDYSKVFQALCLLFTLLFVHLMFTRSSATCLDHIRDSWPRNGVVRLEVVHNLQTLEYKENWINWYKTERSQMTCSFNPADVLLYGPRALPAEIRAARGKPQDVKAANGALNNGYGFDEIDAEAAFNEHFRKYFRPEDAFRYEYRVEYSLLYGILRLPVSFRQKHNITTLWARIDADSECFGDTFSRRVMRAVVGFEDVCIIDAAGLGYLHDLSTNEHFHFVSFMMSKSSYITAAIVMLIFTFAISMLLRFSHHQIFLFIVDLLHMFELNQPLVFPAAPLLTVILALVGTFSPHSTSSTSFMESHAISI